MFNPQRGETAIEIDGEAYALCFTLGALAELEGLLGLNAPSAWSDRLKVLTAADLQAVLTALLRAGGAAAPEHVAGRADPRLAARAVAACLKANLT
jgi:hypothetical protein